MATLAIRFDAWSAAAETWLAPACDDAGALDDLRASVADGRATLLTVWDADSMVAAWVVGIVDDALVVSAAGGYLPGVDLYSTCLNALLPTLPTVRRVRMNTKKLGIIRKVQRMGFALEAAVLEMKVAA